MVGAELKRMHLGVKHSPFDLVGGFDRHLLSTSAWDRYGPDICVDLPLEVVDKLLIAYGAVENSKRRVDRESVTEETIGSVKQTPEGLDLLQERRTVLEKERDQLLQVTADGYNALHPYFDVGTTAERPAGVAE
jgi:hypothetical protein